MVMATARDELPGAVTMHGWAAHSICHAHFVDATYPKPSKVLLMGCLSLHMSLGGTTCHLAVLIGLLIIPTLVGLFAMAEGAHKLLDTSD